MEMAHRVTRHGKYELRGPYYDGSFAIVEMRDGFWHSKGLVRGRQAALDRIAALTAEQVSA
jgi:hypothetical protein